VHCSYLNIYTHLVCNSEPLCSILRRLSTFETAIQPQGEKIMSVDMERRIFAQRLVFDWITNVVINYEKLPKANVNYVTTKKQLEETLNAQW